jgi:hypothetical protein
MIDPKSPAERSPINDSPHPSAEEYEPVVAMTVDAAISKEYRETIVELKSQPETYEMLAPSSAGSPLRASCCPQRKQRSCCGTEDKVECCGTPNKEGCRCR